jgi:DNA-binding NarL/FixJ family response regulator
MPQVLLVEDDGAIRTALTRSLRDQGFVVSNVDRGIDALSTTVAAKPDVVLLDLGLPDVDGADVLSMLRAVSGVPVIVATARDDDAEVVRLLDLGADDYVIKPFTASQISARIRAVLRRGTRRAADRRRRLRGLRPEHRRHATHGLDAVEPARPAPRPDRAGSAFRARGRAARRPTACRVRPARVASPARAPARPPDSSSPVSGREVPVAALPIPR